MTPARDISRLIEIMAALRTPGSGCPWDLEQTFRTIAPYTIEEAYEVADAIERDALGDLREELGDLLLQVVYHARMAEETHTFNFGDVVEAITDKMIRRHPHVFGSEAQRSAGAAEGFWDKIKAQEKAARGSVQQDVASQSLLSEVPAGLPALTRAVKLQDKAAKIGFDWPHLQPVFDKLREEIGEFADVALPADPRKPSTDGRGTVQTSDKQKIEEEFGDILFVMANIARHLSLDPESALRGANQKFVRRFAHIEKRLSERGARPQDSNLAEMDRLWDEAKAIERQDAPANT